MSDQSIDTLRANVVIEQCLFGYRHGHRLLASSQQIPMNVQQSFLGRTDAKIDSLSKSTLLQGFPVPTANAYAVARTWPDRRKNARSGTVLTHLLLIKPADLGLEGIVTPLLELLKDDPNDHEEKHYSQPTFLTQANMSRASLDFNTLNEFDLPVMLEHLYGPKFEEAVTSHVHEGNIMLGGASVAERLLAAIWEQQWPRLRRTFSFIVAGAVSKGSSFIARHAADLLLASTDRSVAQSASEPQPWINNLIDDLVSPGSLSQFLRITGADLQETRSAMFLLVELYQSLTSDNWNQSEFERIARLVLTRYHKLSEGKLLKRKLFDLTEWFERHGFQANEFVEILLDFGREGLTIDAIEWPPLISMAKQQNQKKLLSLIVSTVDDDDVNVSEDFRNTYLSSLTLPELPSLTEALPALFHAALRLHPYWLQEPQLWTDFQLRRESLASAVSTIANEGPEDLDWTAVVQNMLNVGGDLSTNELLRLLPLEALHRFLEALYERRVAAQWFQGLTVRKNEVMDWIIDQPTPPAQLMRWICQNLDYIDMWRPEMADAWSRVAATLKSYPREDHKLFATQALCTTVTSQKIDGDALLQIMEIGRTEVVNDAINSRQRHYLNDHLPRLRKAWENWDLGKRLDTWAAETLSRAGFSRRQVEKAFLYPKKADRLLKAIRTKAETNRVSGKN
jgi:GTPase-associated protein 1, N-terminal domain type 1